MHDAIRLHARGGSEAVDHRDRIGCDDFDLHIRRRRNRIGVVEHCIVADEGGMHGGRCPVAGARAHGEEASGKTQASIRDGAGESGIRVNDHGHTALPDVVRHIHRHRVGRKAEVVVEV